LPPIPGAGTGLGLAPGNGLTPPGSGVQESPAPIGNWVQRPPTGGLPNWHMFPSSSPVTGGYLNIETLDRVLRKYPGVIGRGVPSVRVIAPPLLGCAGDNKYAGQHRQEDRSVDGIGKPRNGVVTSRCGRSVAARRHS
jgi:hypothetical protein